MKASLYPNGEVKTTLDYPHDGDTHRVWWLDVLDEKHNEVTLYFRDPAAIDSIIKGLVDVQQAMYEEAAIASITEKEAA